MEFMQLDVNFCSAVMNSVTWGKLLKLWKLVMGTVTQTIYVYGLRVLYEVTLPRSWWGHSNGCRRHLFICSSLIPPIPLTPPWKWKCCLLSHIRLSATLCTVAHQAHLSMELSRQEYWNGLPLPSLGHLPDPWIEPGSPTLQAGSLPAEPLEKPIGSTLENPICGLQARLKDGDASNPLHST